MIIDDLGRTLTEGPRDGSGGEGAPDQNSPCDASRISRSSAAISWAVKPSPSASSH